MNEKTLKGIVFTNKITIFAASYHYIGVIASSDMALRPYKHEPMASLTWPCGLVWKQLLQKFKPYRKRTIYEKAIHGFGSPVPRAYR